MPFAPLIIGAVAAATSVAGLVMSSQQAGASARAQRQAQQQQQQALNAQERMSNAAAEDAQLQASNSESAATRIARAAGKRVLAFGGGDAGVSDSKTPALADALGG